MELKRTRIPAQIRFAQMLQLKGITKRYLSFANGRIRRGRKAIMQNGGFNLFFLGGVAFFLCGPRIGNQQLGDLR